MNSRSNPSAEELTLLAKSLFTLGFDKHYIYRKVISKTNDQELTKRVIHKIQNDKSAVKSRTAALNGIAIQPREGYLGLSIGVLLIMLGFFIKSFIAPIGNIHSFSFLFMGLGFIIALKHYISPA